MLFNNSGNFIESEKERNFYYKFFCGYYFNELVDGLNERVEIFCEIINNNCAEHFNIDNLTFQISSVDSHVTFDVHSYLVCNNTDNGELADIFIIDNKNKLCLAIEAKFLTDWSYEKDILENSLRIKSCNEVLKEYKFIQCLLIKENKWKEAIKLKNHPYSNYTKIKNQTETSFVVLTWETLIESIPDRKVKEYFNGLISKRKVEFRLNFL